MSKLDDTIVELRKSPLFFLFLSSRELFHSNFWLWLSTINEDETIKLFTDIEIGNELTFKREHRQKSGEYSSTVDLYISGVNSPKIVIENKIKDFPTIEQLEGIKNSFGNTAAEFIVTTLFSTKDLKFNGWTAKTYRDISEKIEPEKFTEDKYHQYLITDYKEFTLTLAVLAEQLSITEEYDFAISLNKKLYNDLNKIKLWEGFQKMRASHLLHHFKNYNKYEVTTFYRINHQKVTIDFVVALKEDYKIGIQIEDNKYRRFIIGPKHDEFSENLRKNNVFFNESWISPKKKPMMSYKPNFKYQYVAILKMKFVDLFERINDDILAIKNNIDIIESHIP